VSVRRLVIALLSLVEAVVACAVFASSLELSRDIQRNETVGHVAQVFAASARQIALVVNHHRHRRTA
jgi:hypothetical protein